MNVFCARDEHCRHWRRTRFALEMNISAGKERIENVCKLQPHTHTASFQQLPNKIYVKMIASHSCNKIRPKMGAVCHAEEIQNASICSVALTYSSKPTK